MGWPQRFAVVLPWLRLRPASEAWRVSAPEVVRYLIQPPMRLRGGRHIRSLVKERDCWKLRLAADAPPIYCPLTIGRAALGMLISEQLDAWNWHYYQIPETRVESGDIVVDAGACEGLFTALSHRCRAVLCVEPSRACQRLLARSFAGHPHIRLAPVLLGERAGNVRFVGSGADARASADDGEKVEMTTLDALCAAHVLAPTYLKADLEGAELEFLRGAAETIRAHRPRIAITAYHAAHHAEEIARFLRQLHPGYRIRCKGITPLGCPVMLHAW